MNEKILAASDVILDRLTGLHPKLIDLSLDRTWRLLAALGHPERALPPVFHIAGTNGKGSVAAYLRACLEAGGYAVHSYTSPHLVRFHERIRLAGRPQSAFIEEPALAGLLDECERANDGAPITFFEITTCAALLAFSRAPADALILEVGMGGRLDTTNVVERPAISVITPVDLDHQAFLGDTIALIAAEKAGILKRGAPAIIGPQPDEARVAIEMAAEKTGTKLFIHGQDFTAHEEAGALVYQDEAGLLDLPLPRLAGRHQIDNAGIAICALRQSGILPLDRAAIADGLSRADWPARLQRLTRGPLIALLPKESDIWLDGGHNPAAGRAVAETMADLAARDPKPLVLVAGMLDTKDAAGFFAPFAGLAAHVETVTIPDAPASLPAEKLAEAARAAGLDATPAVSLESAIARAVVDAGRAGPRALICGSLYLAGHILRDHA
ncbi:folylpolyglutamate synthase/dihydrofolate synthase family protein [Parvibaculum sp.]|uniref:bifunctional folylpolyglutamate synthase/dihydrofolate synthase n=1 Tax=Parvibaculum sp. TaxID=2024848 RepID=UPI001E151228|nr:folylpolyglutamate synthase/dihydrofolate synthase family protein [Parvibaculum sp.]MBX3489971.1 bifunctional folylpolyglutamate synthase/dihydrofolate synthase [Parvibaculum sp.]MCW5726041.1 bifunctional folylpolyglutamate synthase/dihydrofolate synthase [Parvibaculum sp.]